MFTQNVKNVAKV